ncbi:MAG: CHASE2 domain-containing protein [Tolypothrix carrinoi HA7290-LM1]|jgi:CHASE2 domain-containing sensor protein/two-component sensor histidine kinase|nr:CHASE2 domain-containing protein [Tolypothrix carrinoi HA7290-LM1]
MPEGSGTLIWRKIKKEIAIWRTGALPGFGILAIVIIARSCGLLQPLEWMALDTFLRLRPAEPMDNRITIIGITEKDIVSAKTYPIPDKEIATLIRKVQNYQPRVIGLDIVRNISVEPGHKELVDVFKQSKNLITIEKVLPPQYAPPPNVPDNQVGFSDAISDKDGNSRRILIGTPSLQKGQDYKFSLPLRLAKAYLLSEDISLKQGIRDPGTMRFGSVEIPRVLPNAGGYVGIDVGGVQTLLNWRSGKEPFEVVSLNDIKTDKLQLKRLRDRIVLIGITAPSVPDYINTGAVAGLKPNEHIFGVKFHAHACSQIISAVLDERPLLKVWSDEWEYLWIVVWGLIPIIIGRLTQSILKNLFAVGVTSLCLVGGSYLLLIWGWWIPLAPNLLILCINGVGLSAFAFYQRDRALQSQIDERQRTIDQAFTLIHNGPLQTLATALKCVQDKNLLQDKLHCQLQNLDIELRAIGEHFKSEALYQEESLLLGSGLKLDLKLPIHELFYEVYTSTLKRDLPNFPNLKVKTRSFDPIEEKYLSIEQKRELCQFLEEALCNVGKHALGAKRIQATGKKNQGRYTLSIKDNGCGIYSNLENKGTKQAINLARKLGGDFKREPVSHRVTLCELTWSLKSSKGHLIIPFKSFFKVPNQNILDSKQAAPKTTDTHPAVPQSDRLSAKDDE